MTIFGISGSLRAGSYNRALLAAAAAELPAGVEFRVWRGLETLPAYDEDFDRLAGVASVAALRRAILEADAVLIATPEYNESIPARSRTRSTGRRVPFPTTPFAASRSR